MCHKSPPHVPVAAIAESEFCLPRVSGVIEAQAIFKNGSPEHRDLSWMWRANISLAGAAFSPTRSTGIVVGAISPITVCAA